MKKNYNAPESEFLSLACGDILMNSLNQGGDGNNENNEQEFWPTGNGGSN